MWKIFKGPKSPNAKITSRISQKNTTQHGELRTALLPPKTHVYTCHHLHVVHAILQVCICVYTYLEIDNTKQNVSTTYSAYALCQLHTNESSHTKNRSTKAPRAAKSGPRAAPPGRQLTFSMFPKGSPNLPNGFPGGSPNFFKVSRGVT